MTKLKEIRQSVGISQKILAEKSKINIRTIQHYEQGSKVLDHARIDTILKLCIALDCSLYDLIESKEYKELIQIAKIY